MIKHINEIDFKAEVLEENGLVVVDFSAEWCMPCKMLSNVLELISEEIKDIKVAKVDVDENPNISDEYKVGSIPSIKFFKNGNLVEEITGFVPKVRLEEIIKANL